MIVLDASAVLELMLRTDAGSELETCLRQPGETLHCPHLLDLEVAHALRRFLLEGRMNRPRAVEALEDLRGLCLLRYPHEPFLDRILELRKNLTAYDAAYVSLAEALGATLLTCDVGLARTPGHRAKVELVPVS